MDIIAEIEKKRVKRHRVDDVIAVLTTAREKERATNNVARLDYVIAVLMAGKTDRKTIMLPEGGGIDGLEEHLGIPALREDAAAWQRLRREYDEKQSADSPPATYLLRPDEKVRERDDGRWTARRDDERSRAAERGR